MAQDPFRQYRALAQTHFTAAYAVESANSRCEWLQPAPRWSIVMGPLATPSPRAAQGQRMNDVNRATTATLVRYKVLAWMCALSMITYIDRVCIKQVGDEITGDLGITEQEFAWVFAA